MKIAYVVSFKVAIPSKAAHTVNIMNMCGAMVELGHSVSLIIPDSGATDEEIFEYYGLKARFLIHRVRSFSSKWLYPLYSSLALRKIKMINPDFVVGRSALTCLFAGLAGYDLAYDSHSPAWSTGILNHVTYLFLKSSHRLKRMTVNSNALRNMYIATGKAPHCNLIAAHNGSRAQPLNEKLSGINQRANVLQIGYAGHLYRGRGIEIIIECASRLPQFDFHIVGGTEADLDYWKKRATYPNIHFLGFISPSEVYKFRNSMDVLLAPYPKTDVRTAGGKQDQSQYMNPIKVIEYMSSFKAIIASDLPVIREVLDDEKAILVTAEDVDQWVEAIKKLESKEYRQMIAKNAYDFFVANLTWKARARKLIGQ